MQSLLMCCPTLFLDFSGYLDPYTLCSRESGQSVQVAVDLSLPTLMGLVTDDLGHVQVTMLGYSSPAMSPHAASLQPLWSLMGPIPKSALDGRHQATVLAAAGNDVHSPVSYCMQGHRQVSLLAQGRLLGS